MQLEWEGLSNKNPVEDCVKKNQTKQVCLYLVSLSLWIVHSCLGGGGGFIFFLFFTHSYSKVLEFM